MDLLDSHRCNDDLYRQANLCHSQFERIAQHMEHRNVWMQEADHQDQYNIREHSHRDRTDHLGQRSTLINIGHSL